MGKTQVPARIAGILMNALKGGVVPRVGLEYITVGRAQEIAAILHDIDMIADGGASFKTAIIHKAAHEAGIDAKALRRAKGSLKIRSFVVEVGSVWRLPQHNSTKSEPKTDLPSKES